MLSDRTLSRIAVLISLLACIVLAPLAQAQLSVDPTLERGLKPYGTFEGGAVDSVSVTNGNLNLHIPLISYPQRGGKLHLGFYVKFDNNSYTYSAQNQTACDQPPHVCAWGTNVNGPLMEIVPDLDFTTFVSGVIPPSNGPYATIKTSDGAQHEMGATSSGNWMTVDGTGWVCLSNCATVIDRNGIRYSTSSPGGKPTRFEDPNGNLITSTTNANGIIQSYQDTQGRTIPVPPTIPAGGYTDFSGCTGTLPTAAATLWTPPGYQGGTMNFKFCYATVYYGAQTCRDLSGVTTCSVTLHNSLLLQSILLPNNTSWIFQYDSANPNISGSSASGNLLQVTLPTGGYIRYAWGAVYICQTPSVSAPTTYSYAVGSRITNSNDGTGEHTWSYTFPSVGAANNSPYTTTSVDPLGQKIVHTLTTLNDTCSFYETQNQTYDSSANLLKTVVTAYNSNPDYLWSNTGGASHPASNVFPTTVTTIWPNGQQSQQATDYDTGIGLTGLASGHNALYGLAIAKRDYDYGNGAPGALLRQVKTAYVALSGPNAASYLANNLLSLPYTIQNLDGVGTQLALTQLNYDESAPSASGLTSTQQFDSAPPAGAHRGNVTSRYRWLNSGTLTCPGGGSGGTGSNLIERMTYFDSGMLATSADPCGHADSYAYSLTYWGALSTTVTNALAQSTTNTYDFDTDLLLSTTDPNLLQTTYNYDEMWRPLQIIEHHII
jgi:hypothetical protein